MASAAKLHQMQDYQEWVAMFRRIPANLQETLALVTNTGAEVVVHKILKLEPEFIILRGRLSGTQDNRVMIMPYAGLALITVTRVLKDTEVEAIFGKGAPSAAADLPSVPAGEKPVSEAPDEVAEEPPPEVEPAKKPVPVSKSALVAKLRDRLKDSGPTGK